MKEMVPALLLVAATLGAAGAQTLAKGVSPRLRNIYVFAGGGDGSSSAGVVIGSGGVIYGTTSNGGSSNNGTVFSLAPPTSKGAPWTQTVLYSFTGGDGTDPSGGVTVGKGGVLYGTTLEGGYGGACYPNGCGTVFSLTPPASPGDSWTEEVVHAFSDSEGDGAFPEGGLVSGKGGVLYGVAPEGGFPAMAWRSR